MLWFTPTWHDDRTETDRFSILYGLRIGGSSGLVRTLFKCSLHDKASSENRRRVQRHAESWQEWKNTKFQSPEFQILHTSMYKCKDKCRTVSSNPAQHPTTNTKCTLTGHGAWLDLSLTVITGVGYLFDRTGQKHGRPTQHSSSFNTFRISKWGDQALHLMIMCHVYLLNMSNQVI